MKDTGAVVVSWNSEAEIGACLDAALAQVDQVVVVDNASSDGSREEVRKRPTVKLISNPDNRGFAGGVNQGILALDASLILVLNPDTVLLTGIEPLVAVLKTTGVGAAAGKLVDKSSRPQAGFSVRRFPTPLSLAMEVLGVNRLWPRNRVNRRYRCLEIDLGAEAEVEQPAGAFLMIRRDAWEAVGGFDAEFHPVWFEDVDFLKRLREGGYRARYVPACVARHSGGRSVAKLSEESRQACWYASLLRYSFKHFRAPGRLMVWGAVVAGCTVRMLYAFLGQWKLSSLTVYGRVVRLAWIRLMTGRIGESGGLPILARQ